MPKGRPKAPRRSKIESPTCNCVLLCDEVRLGFARPKHDLLGVINVIGVPRLPAVIGPYAAYVRISNLYGPQRVRISLIQAESDTPVIGFEAQLEQSDPLGVSTVVAAIAPFEVREAGRYIFQATHDGVPIAQSPVMIVQAVGSTAE